MDAQEVMADVTGSNVVSTSPTTPAILGEWGWLEHEPCRFCRIPGGVHFLINDEPYGHNASQEMRCDKCKRTWNDTAANA